MGKCIKPWTTGEERIIRQDAAAGVSRAETVQKLGRSYSAVAARARQLGCKLDGPPRFVWTESYLRECAELVSRIGIQAAAEQLGKQPAALSMGLRRAGMYPKDLRDGRRSHAGKESVAPAMSLGQSAQMNST
jgi:hypothetical protein